MKQTIPLIVYAGASVVAQATGWVDQDAVDAVYQVYEIWSKMAPKDPPHKPKG